VPLVWLALECETLRESNNAISVTKKILFCVNNTEFSSKEIETYFPRNRNLNKTKQGRSVSFKQINLYVR